MSTGLVGKRDVLPGEAVSDAQLEGNAMQTSDRPRKRDPCRIRGSALTRRLQAHSRGVFRHDGLRQAPRTKVRSFSSPPLEVNAGRDVRMKKVHRPLSDLYVPPTQPVRASHWDKQSEMLASEKTRAPGLVAIPHCEV